jgi:tetratricopeptide (TPR) repeat protein
MIPLSNAEQAQRVCRRADAAEGHQEATFQVLLDSAEAHFRLASALAGLKQFDAAVTHYQEAVRLQPDFSDSYDHLGHLFVQQTRWDDAAAALQQLLRLRPTYAEAHYRLGCTLTELGKPEEAADCFQQAVRLRPDYAEAHWALTFNWLLRGDFERAWPESEGRWHFQRSHCCRIVQPCWDGSSLAGRTILLHAEQGLGDMIQFIRFAAIVKGYGGTVIVECPKQLLPLFRSCRGIDHLVAAGSLLPAFDLHISLLSVPPLLKTSLATLPAEVPYLAPDPNLAAYWQRRLSRFSGLKIGIAWQGNPRHPNDRQRSFPLHHFAALARLKNVYLISLQKGPGTDQLHTLADCFPVIEFTSWLDDTGRAFVTTPALMKNLDLVIAPDTAVAHLAGALGVPVWIALPFAPDWRWMLQREDSPWYPTMRLFRQKRRGDWDEVFERIWAALAERVGEEA